MSRTYRLLIVILLLGGLPLLAQVSQVSGPTKKQQKPFSPMQAPPNAQYVGSKACAQCHDEHAKHQIGSSMGQALQPCQSCDVLRANPSLTWQSGKYSYKIERKGEQSWYTVTDGVNSVTEPILWCFGKGDAGQTYVLQHNGRFYESRASFYTKVKGLDTTLGAPNKPPTSMEEAVGRALQSADVKDCFGCHATAALSEGKLQLEKMTPGITCESCHGPGAEHVALANTGKTKAAKDKMIFNPATLGAYELSQQFCGACHRSWDQVMTEGTRGVANVRFQPYRLVYSPCYDSEDKRISCTACHNPHEAAQHELASYDTKCLACHQVKGKSPSSTTTTAKRAATCRVGTAKCALCHMPRYEMPGSHFTFTDHFIRIVKPGEQYPN
jgi:hypothetical protein